MNSRLFSFPSLPPGETLFFLQTAVFSSRMVEEALLSSFFSSLPEAGNRLQLLVDYTETQRSLRWNPPRRPLHSPPFFPSLLTKVGFVAPPSSRAKLYREARPGAGLSSLFPCVGERSLFFFSPPTKKQSRARCFLTSRVTS